MNFTGSYPWPYYMEYSHHKAARKGYIEVSEVEKYLLKLRAGNVVRVRVRVGVRVTFRVTFRVS